MTNRERAERASEVMLRYSDMIGDASDMEVILSDLIADCCHALGREPVTWAVHRGLNHYDAERGGAE